MNDKNRIQLDLLMFSVAGVYYAADAAQIAGVEKFRGGRDGSEVWFHEEMEFGCGDICYSSPTVLTIRSGAETTQRVIIDKMEDIMRVTEDDISLFPPLVETFALKKGLWGILLLDGVMVLLLDFERLFSARRIRTV
ncbi:MAG: hypothetical protein PHN84_02955 [Desulfuromonadaceae bacterium]|nr:hypothetical protein [Desulfuromonadaceae bacterium]MDD2854613.1 hypothetical protein [Desulfuromonadaceae bacterium]